MIPTFDTDKLNALLKDFNTLTGIRITVFSDDFTELASYPSDIAPICSYIRTDPKARHACHVCDIKACKKAAALRKPYIYQCHAGLTEAVTPVYMGNLIIAYLLFGHLFSYPSQFDGWEHVRASCEKYDFEESKLREFVTELPITSNNIILSASHILQSVASFLCMEKLITLHQQTFPAKLDEYIETHFTEKINAGSICDHFGIGKTYLYKISRQSYGCGVAEHIRTLRINKAKELLSGEPEMSISEIAEKCGFSDYNYFITVFKKSEKITPKAYIRARSAGFT